MQGAVVTSSVGLRLIEIKPGQFMMGSPPSEPGHDSDERLHRVEITRPFFIGETPVTQGHYRSVTGANPSRFADGGEDLPVESVNWFEAIEYCARLTELDRKAGKIRAEQTYRLPSEAEWEYACRGGAATALYTGPITILGENNAPELESIAWYGGNSAANYGSAISTGLEIKRSGPIAYWTEWKGKSHHHKSAGPQPVGLKRPNHFQLRDMLGNINEWCFDWYELYPNSFGAKDPGGPHTGTKKVHRGGAWNCIATRCRCAFRGSDMPNGRHGDLGFRVVLSF